MTITADRPALSPWKIDVALGALAALMAWVFFDSSLETWGDNAIYMSVAESFARTGEFREIHSPIHRLASTAHVVFPLLLSPLATLAGPERLLAMKMLIAAFFVVLPPLVRRVLRNEGATEAVALGAACCSAVTPMLVVMSHHVMTEIPYATVSLAGILAFQASDNSNSAWKLPLAIAGAFLVVCSSWIRAIGIALVAAVLIWRLAHRRFRDFAAVLAFFFVGRAVLKSVAGPPDAQSSFQHLAYINPYDPNEGTITLAQFAERLWANANLYVGELIPQASFWGAIPRWLAITFAVLAFVQVARDLRERRLLGLYVLGWFAILSAWPQQYSVHRFVTPVVPLVLYLTISGLDSVVKQVGETLGRNVAGARTASTALLSAVIAAFALRETSEAIVPLEPAWANYYGLLDWTRTNVEPDAIIVSRKPQLGWVLSGRESLPVYYGYSPAEALAEYEKQGADYVIVDRLGMPGTREVLVPMIEAYPQRFQAVTETKEPITWLFRLVPAPAELAPTAPEVVPQGNP